MDELTTPLQTHIQINLYRLNHDRFEYLVLRRVDNEKDFWQSVTERVPDDGDVAETVKRAVAEQVGIRSFKRFSEEMYSYEWYTHGERGRDIVFAAEVTPQTTVTIDTKLYSDFQWLPYQEALLHIKWSGAKDALEELNNFLEAKRRSNPEYWAEETPSQPAGPRTPDEAMDVGQTALEHSQPQEEQPLPPSQQRNQYGFNTPKRLPDRPGTGGMGVDNEKEINTGEWFL